MEGQCNLCEPPGNVTLTITSIISMLQLLYVHRNLASYI